MSGEVDDIDDDGSNDGLLLAVMRFVNVRDCNLKPKKRSQSVNQLSRTAFTALKRYNRTVQVERHLATKSRLSAHTGEPAFCFFLLPTR